LLRNFGATVFASRSLTRPCRSSQAGEAWEAATHFEADALGVNEIDCGEYYEFRAIFNTSCSGLYCISAMALHGLTPRHLFSIGGAHCPNQISHRNAKK
jgi:hypothetical protein